jgi:hypothetical protein
MRGPDGGTNRKGKSSFSVILVECQAAEECLLVTSNTAKLLVFRRIRIKVSGRGISLTLASLVRVDLACREDMLALVVVSFVIVAVVVK